MKPFSFSATLALLTALLFCMTPSARAVGSWTPLGRQAPNGISTMLLLTDGTVMAQGSDTGGTSNNWYKLTPDAGGSYVNGTWTQLASMHQTRQYYASVVMANGQVFVAGGEYSDAGSDTNTAEIYDPPTNTWTVIPGPSGWANIGDAPVASLADGRLLLGALGSGQTALYNYSTGVWTNAANKLHDYSSTEESWALLPNGSVLAVDCTNQINNSEQYVPASNTWLDAGNLPSGHGVVDPGSAEIGPAMTLPNGNVLYVGSTGHTALYSTTTSTWLAGPDYPTVLDVDSRDSGSGSSNTYNTQVPAQAKDAPGCLMVNGKVLTEVGPTGYNNNSSGGNGGYPSGLYFFEYDPGSSGAGTLTAAPYPGGSVPLSPTFVTRMLALPSGQVLFSNYSSQLYIYTPDSGPNPSWEPVISSVTQNADGSYLVQGTQFNGLSEASAYGDDASEATNYPLVRLTDSNGKVTYARTYNHSTMGIATGNTPVSTNFLVPTALANGAYQMQVVANGIASVPVSFNYTRLTTPPAAPTNLTAAPGVGQVSLNWTASSRATSYDIYRSTTPGGEATPIAATAGPSFIDTGLTAGTTYYYKVNALNSYGASALSNEAAATPQPLPPGVVLPTSEQTGYSWKYMLTTPPSNWYTTTFNDYAWNSGLAGFGSINFSGAVSRTSWTITPGNIWIRRHFPITGSVPANAQFRVFYDEGCEIYLNGVQAASTTGYVTSYVSVPMNSAGQTALQVGDNVIAVHCTQTAGGQYIDVGIQAPPAAPTSLSATAGSGQVALNWTAGQGAASYNIYRAATAGGEGATPIQTGVTATSYTDSGLTNGTTYYYKVTAVNPLGESGASNEAFATPGSASSSLVNGSFETPSVGSASYQYNPTGGSWAFSGYSGIQSNGSAFGAANAPDGTQTAFLQGYPGPAGAGSISQSINFASAGTYVLTFQAARRQGQVQPLRFSVDGVQVGGTLTPAGSTFQSYTVSFPVSAAGAHTLTLSATDNSADLTTFIDQVSVAPSLVGAVANGSFEAPSVGSASYQYNPTGGSWAFSGYSGIQSSGSAFGAANAPNGTQTAFLQGYAAGSAGPGSISQSVTFPAAGNYALTFQAARRGGQVQPLRFSVDGVQVGNLLTPAGSNFGLLTSATFNIGIAGPHTLTLSATDSSGDLTALVDQLALSPK